MPVNIIDTIVPKNNGQFPVVTDINVAGGFQVQPTTAARDAIPIQNQKVGMLVYVTGNTTYYTLSATGSPGTWAVANLGGTTSLSGDVTGSTAANTVTKFQGRTLSNAAPADGQTLSWVSSTNTWTPVNQQVGTVTQLRTTNPVTATAVVNLQGYNAIGDGGGGIFYWNSTSTITDNGGTIFAVTGIVTGRWIRQAALAYTANVAWFGGTSNANFFNSSNGRYYQDAGLTIEASDDAVKFRNAVAYIASLGGGSIYVPAGTWYFTTAPSHSANPIQITHDFCLLTNNLTIFGEDTGSTIFIRGGTTTGSTGYAAIFGQGGFNYNTVVNNVTIRNLTFNHNSQHNQWAGPNFNGLSGDAQTASIALPAGNNNEISNCTVLNHNGVFVFAPGTYQFAELVNDCRIVNNLLFHLADDPHMGDFSWIGGAGTDLLCANNIIDGYIYSAHTAIELHGVNVSVCNNVIKKSALGVLHAADSENSSNFLCTGNLIDGAITGIFIVCLAPRTLDHALISNNTILVRSASSISPSLSTEEEGILISNGGSSGTPELKDVQILNNQATFQYGTPTVANSFGMHVIGNFAHLIIRGNVLRGFGTFGTYIQTALAANAGNNQTDLTYTNNTAIDCGQNGLGWVGDFAGGEASPTAKRNLIFDNTAVSTTGSGLSAGISISHLYIDNKLFVGTNPTFNSTTGLEFQLDTTTYPVGPLYPSPTFLQIVSVINGTATNPVPSLFLENLTPATSGAPDQYPPILHFEGRHWDSGSSANQSMELEEKIGTGLGDISWSLQGRKNFNNDGSQVFANIFTMIWQPLTSASLSSSLPFFIDQSGEGHIEERYGAGSGKYWQVTENGTVRLKSSNSIITINGANINLQQSLTDYIQIGATPASTTGQIRFSGGAVNQIVIRDNANANDIITMATDAANNVYLGPQTHGGVLLLSGAGGVTVSSNIGFYGTSPVAQQTRAGQLTNSSGGIVSGTIAAVSGTGDDTDINNNFASLTAKVNALETIIHNLGLST